MSDFGHTASTFKSGEALFHVDAWGAGPFMFRIDGRRWFFEDSDMFGPAVIGKRDWQPVSRQPGERSRFWDAFSMWRKAGRPVRGTGRIKVAVWSEPQPGEYWKDERGISHFLRDPDVDRAGYREVPKPDDAP